MANTAAYAGPRWGELSALTIPQIDPPARIITIDRKIIEIGGTSTSKHPRTASSARTIYPAHTPDGYPLAGKLAARIEAARAEHAAGTNPHGLIFPSPRGTLWRSSNFARRVLAPAYTTAGWRDPDRNGPGPGTACATSSAPPPCSPGTLDPTDVSRMAGHANYRITLDMYLGTTAGILDRARHATQ